MKIIYEKEEGGIALMVLAPKYNNDLQNAARRFVPKGRPFLLINDEDIPQDDIFFEAWEADFSDPHGIGEFE